MVGRVEYNLIMVMIDSMEFIYFFVCYYKLSSVHIYIILQLIKNISLLRVIQRLISSIFYISILHAIVFLTHPTPTLDVFISPPVINLLNYHIYVPYVYTMCVSNLVNIGCGHSNIIPICQI